MDILTSTFTTTLSAVTHLVSFPTSTITTFLRPLDTLFNIPLVSVLLLPSLSSWSTSFNVLFFYATWSLLLFSHGRIAVEFWGTLLIRLVFFVVPSTLFLVLDGCLPFVMRSIKQHGEAGIASIAARQTGRTRASRARSASRTAASMSGGEILRRVASSIKTRSTRRSRRSYGSDTTGTTRASVGAGVFGSRWWWLRMVSLSLFNIMLGILLQTSIAWILARLNDKRKNARGALRVAAALPLPWAMIKQLIAAWVLREVIAYTTHRYLLHADGTGSTASATSHAASADYSSDEDGSYVYESNDSDNNSYFASRALRPKSKPIFLLRTLTSWHATHYHTSNLVVPVPFSAHYDHPVVYLLRVWLPDYLPAAILHMHLLTYHLWLALLSIEESLVYSNYSSLPTGLLLGGMARRAERHMLTGGCGNFAPYGVMDLLMGTSVSTSASGAVSSAIAAALDGTEEGDDEYENLLEDAVYEANRRNIPERARRKGRMIRDKFEEEMGEGGGSEGNGSARAGRANGGPSTRKSRTSNARRSKSRRRGGADSDAEWVGDDNGHGLLGGFARNETGSGSRKRTATRASGRAKEGDKSDKDKSKSRAKKGESSSKESGGLFRRVRKTMAG